MRSFWRIGAIGLLVVGAAAAAYRPAAAWWELRTRPKFRTAEVIEGPLVHMVRSTGTVKPVKSVAVGTFVSGPIAEVKVDFNDRVAKGDVLAIIDSRLYDANLSRDMAVMATQKAQVVRIEAELKRAERDEERSQKLREKNKDYISDTEMDQYKFATMSLKAQLVLAKASVDQAAATVENSKANVGYTKIISPVDGIVIDKKIDSGQTLAAQFQTPELFVVAPDMDKLMHVFAAVDEADIGLIRAAKEKKLPVTFTVDAYQDTFSGEIHQVRSNSTTTQNVVTYPVVVAAPNLELKLLPGMTASLDFQVDSREKCVKVPNAALRYFPRPENVREEDKEIVEPKANGEPVDRRKRGGIKHVWVAEEGKLRAIEVHVGISDNSFTELLKGDVKPGMKLAVGLDESKPGARP